MSVKIEKKPLSTNNFVLNFKDKKINIKTQWQLEKYFYKTNKDPQIQKDLAKFIDLISIFRKEYLGKISNLNDEQILKMLKDQEKIQIISNKLGIYFSCLTAIDSQNQDYLKQESAIYRQIIEVSNQLLFVDQELKQLGKKKLLEISKNSKYQEYSNYWLQKAKNLHYLLDEKIENTLNQKASSSNLAFVKMYDEYVGNLSFEIEKKGKIEKVTEEEVRTLRMHSKEEKRKMAFESLKKTYLEDKNRIVLSNVYTSIVKDWTTEVKMRNFKSVMGPRNLGEEMEDETIATLLTTVTKNFDIYHKYLDVKNRYLQKIGSQKDGGKLKYWNIYAPVATKNKKYSLDEALKIYLECMQNFDSEFFDFAIKMFDENRVDVYPKFGKKGGAFCIYDKNLPSLVLLNYTGTIRDISTIAHEFGHGIHGYYSQAQNTFNFHSVLCLAETASVFSETLFGDYLESQLTSKEEKIEFLDARLQDLFATIFRQVMYVNFENEVHNKILAGQELSYIDLNNIWRQKQQELVGSEVEFDLPSDKEYGWSSIPHLFHSPFYCYSYAFGNILSLSLYEKYKTEGKKFITKYKKILASGSSKEPKELLLDYDIDITKPKFYNDGLLVVKDLVEEFSELIER